MTIQRVADRRYRDGQAFAPGRLMAAYSPFISFPPAPTERGTTLESRSPMSHGDHIRATHRDSLGAVAARVGLRQWGDLLAATAAVAGAGALGTDPPGTAGRSPGGGRARLVTRRHRFSLQPGRFWGAPTGPNPTDRATAGIKRHVLSDGQGVPRALQVTPANVHDTTQALPLLDAIPPIPGPRGRPCRRPLRLQGDRAYGSAANRQWCRQRQGQPHLASPRPPHGSGLGKTRWVLERPQAWYAQFRRLRVCYEQTLLSTLAFHLVATILIVWNALQRL